MDKQARSPTQSEFPAQGGSVHPVRVRPMTGCRFLCIQDSQREGLHRRGLARHTRRRCGASAHPPAYAACILCALRALIRQQLAGGKPTGCARQAQDPLAQAVKLPAAAAHDRAEAKQRKANIFGQTRDSKPLIHPTCEDPGEQGQGARPGRRSTPVKMKARYIGEQRADMKSYTRLESDM